MMNTSHVLVLILLSRVYAHGEGEWSRNEREGTEEGSVLCRSSNTCGTCLLDLNCGWCASAGVCVEGTTKGPTAGNCTEWDFQDCSAAKSSWTMFGNGPAHTGLYPFPSTYNSAQYGVSPVPLWTLNNTYTSLNEVIVVNGIVYVTGQTHDLDHKGMLLALDEETGKTIWSHDFGAGNGVNPPAYSGGNIYVQCTFTNYSDVYFKKGLLYSLNAENGSVLWTAPYTVQFQVYTTFLAPTIDNGKVCAEAGADGGLCCYDQATGKQLFCTVLPQYGLWTPSIMKGRLFAWVSTTFYEISLDTGAMLWSRWFDGLHEGAEMSTAVVLDLPLAFVVNFPKYSDAQLIAINVDTRAVVWTSPMCLDTERTTPSIADGLVFFACKGVLYVLDEKTGKTISSAKLAYPLNQPVVTPTEVIVPQTEVVTAFLRKDYTPLWSVDAFRASISYNGNLFLSTGQTIQAFKLA